MTMTNEMMQGDQGQQLYAVFRPCGSARVTIRRSMLTEEDCWTFFADNMVGASVTASLTVDDSGSSPSNYVQSFVEQCTLQLPEVHILIVIRRFVHNVCVHVTFHVRLSFTAGESARARGVDSWSALEERSLVEFVTKKGFVKDWPHTKRTDIWEGAAKFLEQFGFAKRTSKCYKLLLIF